jgi:hypothetical protein
MRQRSRGRAFCRLWRFQLVAEAVEVDWFDEVIVEAGLDRASSVSFLSIAGQRDQARRVEVGDRAREAGRSLRANLYCFLKPS